MNMPDGVNHTQFYLAAKAKGIVVSSKYPGVFVQANKGKPIVWRSQVIINGKIFTKAFPFDKYGEVAASKYYLSLKQQLKSI